MKSWAKVVKHLEEGWQMKITLLSEAEIRGSVGMDSDAYAAVAEGFSRLAEGKIFAPPVMCIEIPEHHGEVDVKAAYIEGLDSFAVKVASGFSDNPKKGLASSSGMMMLVSAETGLLKALLLDNGYLTDVRTGLAGAIAAEHLAPRDIETAGVIGSGMQARYQMRGLKLVREFRRLLVYGIVPDEVERYAAEMRNELGVQVVVADGPDAVVSEAQAVVTTTPSREPYLRPEWLHPGLHVTCMGADTDYKQELFSDCFARADCVVCDRLSQVKLIGELHHAFAAGVIDESAVLELGELTSGSKPGRRRDDEITICDLTGVGVQDTAIARLAFARAVQKGLGTAFGESEDAVGLAAALALSVKGAEL
jgi:ornithine cyclodeaminase